MARYLYTGRMTASRPALHHRLGPLLLAVLSLALLGGVLLHAWTGAGGVVPLTQAMQGTYDYRIQYLGRPIGTYQSRIAMDADGIHFTSALQMDLTDEVSRHTTEALLFSLRPPHRLLQAERQSWLNDGAQQSWTRLAGDGHRYRVTHSDPDRTDTEFAVDYRLRDHLSLELQLDEAVNGESELTARTLNLEDLTVNEQRWRARALAPGAGFLLRRADGDDEVFYLDEHLVPGAMAVAELFTFQRNDRPELAGFLALQRSSDSGAPLLSPIPVGNEARLARLDRQVDSPLNVRRATLGVSPDIARSLADMPGLQWREPAAPDEPWLLKLDADTAATGASSTPAPGGLSGRHLPRDHPRVQAELQRALSPAALRDERSQVEALTRYVYDRLNYRPGKPVLGLLDALDRGYGDCTEFADLFTALARAAGLATHTVVGLNYAGDEEPGLYLHAWNLVAVDGHWLPVDPTAGIVGGHGLQIAFPSDSAGYLRAYAAFAGAELALVDVEYFNEQPAADTL